MTFLAFLAGLLARSLYDRWRAWEHGENRSRSERGVDLVPVPYWRFVADPADTRTVGLMDDAEIARRIGA